MSDDRGHSKPAREIFLTSSSLSFSSLSSSSTSWDDAKESKTSCEDKIQQKGKLPMAPSHVRMQPAPSPPSRLPPVQLMNKGLGHYDPGRISSSVFNKTGEGNWSEISNESLFSIKVDGVRMSNVHGFRISNMRPEEVMMSGEFLSFSPSLLGKPEVAEEKKRAEVKEIKSGGRSIETNSHQEKSSSSTPVMSCSSNFCSLYQSPPTKTQSCPLPVGEKESKKIKKTKKSKQKKKNKKKKKKKKKSKCCLWSWLCSGFSKYAFNWCCCKWRKWCCCFCCCCCREPKPI